MRIVRASTKRSTAPLTLATETDHETPVDHLLNARRPSASHRRTRRRVSAIDRYVTELLSVIAARLPQAIPAA